MTARSEFRRPVVPSPLRSPGPSGGNGSQGVLFVGAFPAASPLTRYVSGDLGQRLTNFGWNVSFTSQGNNRLVRLVDMAQAILRRRQRYHVACVDVFSGSAFLWAQVAAVLLRRLGKPCVLTLHGGNLPAFARENPARVRRLLASAAAVTCPSAYLHKEMRVFRDDLLLIPNGVDLKLYNFHLRYPPFSRLVWLRDFHSIYNPEMAVWVLHHLQSVGRKVQLTMFGLDKHDGSLGKTKALAARLGLEHQISFPGSVPKERVPTELNTGDVFLNTTNFDNTPVSVIEAMASGLPVVSTKVGGIPYLLKHDDTALLVAPGDSEQMARQVQRLTTEPGLASRLGANGRKLVESFDWEYLLPQWDKLLRSVAARQPLCVPSLAAPRTESGLSPSPSPCALFLSCEVCASVTLCCRWVMPGSGIR